MIAILDHPPYDIVHDLQLAAVVGADVRTVEDDLLRAVGIDIVGELADTHGALQGRLQQAGHEIIFITLEDVHLGNAQDLHYTASLSVESVTSSVTSSVESVRAASSAAAESHAAGVSMMGIQ